MRNFNDKSVLVTGGLGFIGRNLVAGLLDEGAKVTIVDRDFVDARALRKIGGESNGQLRFVMADIGDAKAAKNYVAEQEIVFHLAGHSGPVGSLGEPFVNLDVNCRGTLTLLEALREKSPNARVIFPSSRLVYGLPEYLPVDEEHPTRPITLYGIHKLAVEGYLRVYQREYNLETVVFRISNPFGPHVPAPHHKYNILNWFIDRALQGDELTVYGEGEQTRDYLYIADLIDAFLLSAVKPEAVGKVMNIGAEPIPFVEMAKMVVDVVGSGYVRHVPWPEDYKRVETGDWDFDESKAKEILGWGLRTDLEGGIEQTVKMYNKQDSTLGRLLQL